MKEYLMKIKKGVRRIAEGILFSETFLATEVLYTDVPVVAQP